jgi:RNA polymerase sigma factor (sigma-70 family)
MEETGMQLYRHPSEPTDSNTDDSPPERLYRLHAALILAFVRLHINSPEEAEDLVIEVFMAALEYPKLLERDTEVQRAWLRKVAHHKIVDHYRRGARRQFVALELVAETLYEEEGRSPEHQALQQESYQQVMTLLKRLPVFQQQVVSLRVIYGLRCTEIASALGKKESTVRTALARALNRIRTHYTGQSEAAR